MSDEGNHVKVVLVCNRCHQAIGVMLLSGKETIIDTSYICMECYCPKEKE